MLSNIIYKNNNKAENLCCVFLSLLPIIFFFGNGAGNTLVITIDILFLYILIKNKQLNFLNNYLFYLLLIFWFILLGNLIFSTNFENSLGRSIGFIRFIFLVFAIKFFFKFEKDNYKDLILKFWFFFLSVISLDIIFEVIFGFNTLGFSSYMPGRLSSFFNQELKIGNLYSSFYLIILSFILYSKSSDSKFGKKIFKNYNLNYLFFFILFFILISFLIGERSNLIRVPYNVRTIFFYYFKKLGKHFKIFNNIHFSLNNIFYVFKKLSLEILGCFFKTVHIKSIRIC